MCDKQECDSPLMRMARKAAQPFRDDPRHLRFDAPGHELPREDVISFINISNIGREFCHAPGCAKMIHGQSRWCDRCSKRAGDIFRCLSRGIRDVYLMPICDLDIVGHRAYRKTGTWRGVWCPRCAGFAAVISSESGVEFEENDENHWEMAMSTYYSDCE